MPRPGMVCRDYIKSTIMPRRLRRQRTRTIFNRLSLVVALATGGAGAVLHAPSALFLGAAWLAGAGVAPLMGLHGEGMQISFGIMTGATAIFLYSLLAWP